jgi:hypothetical protein
MRSATKVAFVAMLAVAIASIILTATAQAAEGPFYQPSGLRLEEKETLEEQEVAKSSFKVEYTGGTITCTSAPFAAGATLNGSSGANASTSTETIEFSGCTVTGNGSECKVEGEKIKTASLKSTLGYANEKRELPLLEIIEPVSGKAIAEVKFSGKCTVSATKVTGAVVGEVVKPEEEGTEKELKITKAARTIWTESGGKLTSTKPTLEVLGLAATEEETDELQTKDAPMTLGPVIDTFPSSLCESEPMGSKCHAGTYWAEGTKFKLESISELEISKTGKVIKCETSDGEFTLGKNPEEGALSIKVTSLTFGGCKLNGTTACTLTVPAAGELEPPWTGALEWTTSASVGPNGSLRIGTLSIKASCGAEGECSYSGNRPNKTLGGYLYNPGVSNKPVPLYPWSEVKFQTWSAAGVNCSGFVDLAVVYAVIPTRENVYLAHN